MKTARILVADANARLKEKKLPAAAEAALAAREKSPENDEAWVIWAATELSAGRRSSALDALRRAVELNPANRRQLPKDQNFESLWTDPQFKRIVGS